VAAWIRSHARPTPTLALSALAAALAAGCGAASTQPPASAAGTSPARSCPAAWRAGWQALANRIGAPVYCPSWLPNPLDGQIGGSSWAGTFVNRRRAYLVSFLVADPVGRQNDEVHVNVRGYPGQTAIPTCEDTLTVHGKTVHPKAPCFADARARKRFGRIVVTEYTANLGADQWHVLYAWRYRGSLYAISEHVTPPYSFEQVVANLDRMMRGLVLVLPAA
jgi:hypothetical protein